MKTELITKYTFESSHSLVDYETPHPHLWNLEVRISGQPQEGRIIDIVKFRREMKNIISPLELTYLNDNPIVDSEVRTSPTCETLVVYFHRKINEMLHRNFLPTHPTVKLAALTVSLCEMDGTEMGAVCLSIQ